MPVPMTAGIDLSNGSDQTSIQDNFIYDNPLGIEVRPASVTILHNTVAHCSGNGIGYTGPASASHVVVNNIIANTGGLGIDCNQGTFDELGYNLYFENLGGTLLDCPVDVGSLSGNPYFINVPGRDLRVRSTSPAVDNAMERGLDRNGPFAPDVFYGFGPDIGAYEAP